MCAASSGLVLEEAKVREDYEDALIEKHPTSEFKQIINNNRIQSIMAALQALRARKKAGLAGPSYQIGLVEFDGESWVSVVSPQEP